MKFAHLADCHIGGWREEKLKELTINAFSAAMDECIKERVGFILIAGDLFNTALPSIDLIKETTNILRKVKDRDIPVYVIPGSHDYSPSGRTMLDVLEKAGLIENVMKFNDGKLKFTKDRTNTKITGLMGKAGGLDIRDYENLEKDHLEKEEGFKIFMFHNSLTEFKPKEMEKAESVSVNLLPKNFNYYAGGHMHYILNERVNDGILTYPGPLFPNNFKELEELKYGGFFIVDDKLNVKRIPIIMKEVLSFIIDANEKTPEKVENEIRKKLVNVEDKIITLRVEGILKEGKPSEIDFRSFAEDSNAFLILRNTSKLLSREFEKRKIEGGNIDEIEEKIIEGHLGQVKLEDLDEKDVTMKLLDILNKEKMEGEKNADFENRILKESIEVLKLRDVI